uniref:Phosphoinositide 3-kinase regulatory subunit 5 n=1 Tax=Naja naja TaxID=35670 RepID=A0A8C7E6T2_NAJNA
MQHTTCTEDRIHHALERCLHGLSKSTFSASTWTAGLCLNCWSLQELVNRDAGNYLILLEKILQKTQEVQEKCDYNLFTPLAFLFSATLLCIPHFPSDSDLLLRAVRMYRDFLTWPVPYCNICQELLNFISNELKAPATQNLANSLAIAPKPSSQPVPSCFLWIVKSRLSLSHSKLALAEAFWGEGCFSLDFSV